MKAAADRRQFREAEEILRRFELRRKLRAQGYGRSGWRRFKKRRVFGRRRSYAARHDPQHLRRRRIRRGVWIASWMLLAGAVWMVADGYWQAYRAYQDVKAVIPALNSARSSLAQGKVPPAEEFSAASGAAAQAQEAIDNARFTFGWTAVLPYLGRPVRAVRYGVAAADEEAQAATLMRNMVTDVLGPAALPGPGLGLAPGTASGSGRPRGRPTPSTVGGSGSSSGAGGGTSTQPGTGSDSPIFSDGKADVALIAGLVPRLQALIGHLEAGDRDIRAIPYVPFAGQVEALKAQALDQSSQAIALAKQALTGVRLLPGFFGADRPKTYFMALQNNADLRATGGAILAYAFITIDRGKLQLDQGGAILDIDDSASGFPKVDLPAAIDWYLSNIAHPREVPRIANSNYSPDFPTSARAMADLVRASTGRQVDGVIALDPQAIADLLGKRSIRVESYPARINAGNVVRVVENDQYRLPKPQQKVFPTELIAAAWPILRDLHPLLNTVQQLGKDLAAKRVQLWSNDGAEQEELRTLGWDGAVRSNAGDYLYLVDNKLLSNKVDYYTTTKIDYRVTIDSSGAATSKARITLANGTPPGEPFAITYGVLRGQYALNDALLSLYAPGGAEFRSSNLPPDFPDHREAGKRVFVREARVGGGKSVTVTFTYTTPALVRRTKAGRVYELTVQRQPLVTPADLSVTVTLPPGSVIRAAPGWTVKGNVATLHTALTKDLVRTINF